MTVRQLVGAAALVEAMRRGAAGTVPGKRTGGGHPAATVVANDDRVPDLDGSRNPGMEATVQALPAAAE